MKGILLFAVLAPVAPDAMLKSAEYNELSQKIHKGTSVRRTLQSALSSTRTFSSLPAASMESVIYSAARLTPVAGSNITIRFKRIDGTQTNFQEDLNIFSFALVLKQMLGLQVEAFATKIPTTINARHVFRLRVLRALAPLICRLDRQEFNSATGLCEALTPQQGTVNPDFPIPLTESMLPLSPFVQLGPEAPSDLY